MPYLEQIKDAQRLSDVFFRDPKRYLPFVQLIDGLMAGDSDLTKPERELIALFVSNLNDCHYCVGSHRAALNTMGVDGPVIDAAATAQLAQVDDRMRPVLAFAKKLAVTPGDVGQADIDILREAGWSDQAIEDAICVVSLFSFLNRLVDGIGLKGSPEIFELVGRSVVTQGYAPLAQMLQKKANAA